MTEENTAVAEKNEKAVAGEKEKKSPQKDHRPNRGQRRGQGGNRQREPKEYEETILHIARVTRVVKGGRRMRFRVSVIIGNKKGKVGFGIGKATEVLVGVQKAVAMAKKSLVSVPIFEDSIPHEVKGNYKATKVLLFPAPEGTGVIAGGAVRKILELAGVKNVLSKTHGSRTPINMAHSTFDALAQLQNRTPKKKEKEVEEEAVEGKEEKAKEEKPKKEVKPEEAKSAKKVEKKVAPKKEKAGERASKQAGKK